MNETNQKPWCGNFHTQQATKHSKIFSIHITWNSENNATKRHLPKDDTACIHSMILKICILAFTLKTKQKLKPFPVNMSTIQLAIQSYSVLADRTLNFLLSFFNIFSAVFSLADIAFSLAFSFRTFLVLFIGLPFFIFLFQKTPIIRGAIKNKLKI